MEAITEITTTEIPTPEQIDTAITLYESRQAELRVAEAALTPAKNLLIELIDRFGQVPAHAEQSKRLSGRHNVATVTRGTTVSVDETGVVALRSALYVAGHGNLFPRFFAEQKKHSLVDGARDVLKTVTLPRRLEEKIASLFGKAIDVKSKSPSLKIETVKPEKPVRAKKTGKQAA